MRNCSCSFSNISMFTSCLQDFECDVHLGGTGEDVDGAGDEDGVADANDPGADGEKKEFSFTFYDLDGHGKITKDVSIVRLEIMILIEYIVLMAIFCLQDIAGLVRS